MNRQRYLSIDSFKMQMIQPADSILHIRHAKEIIDQVSI